MKVVHTSKENPLSYLISLSAVSLFQSFLLRHHAKLKTTAYENPALSHGVYFLFQAISLTRRDFITKLRDFTTQ